LLTIGTSSPLADIVARRPTAEAGVNRLKCAAARDEPDAAYHSCAPRTNCAATSSISQPQLPLQGTANMRAALHSRLSVERGLPVQVQHAVPAHQTRTAEVLHGTLASPVTHCHTIAQLTDS
jgi:hypothetical protein